MVHASSRTYITLLCLAIASCVCASNSTANIAKDDAVGWQAGPETRGTLYLVWSCILTMFACTWTVQHLNVPGRNDGACWRLLRRARWMLITILFPEFIFSKAICDLRQALFDLGEFGKRIRKINEQSSWTVQYGSLVDHEWSWDIQYPPNFETLHRLLGLKIPSVDQIYPTEEKPVTKILQTAVKKLFSKSSRNIMPTSSQASCSWRTVQRWTIVHSYYAQMGGLLMPKPFHKKEKGSGAEGEQFPNLKPTYIVFTPWRATWDYTEDEGSHPLKHLILSEQSIQNASKADWLLKTIAILQVVWLILNVAGRGISGLHVTQLEVATVAFAIMAGLTYVANWWKPKDVSEATILRHYSVGKPDSPNRVRQYWLWLKEPAKILDPNQRNGDILRVRNDTIRMKGRASVMTITLAISSFFFGGFHCVAWNFKFPSEIELTLWRVSCVVSAALPAITLGISSLSSHLSAIGLLSLYKYIDPSTALGESWALRALFLEDFLSAKWWEHILWPALDDLKKHSEAHSNSRTTQLRQLLSNLESAEGSHRNYEEFLDGIRNIHDAWWRFVYAQQDLQTEDRKSMQDVYARTCSIWVKNESLRKVWLEYESVLAEKLGITYNYGGVDRDLPTWENLRSPTMQCIMLLQAFYEDDTNLEWARLFKGNRVFVKFVRGVSLVNGMAYIAARLIMMLLLFTSLRVTPADTYRVISWLRFLPNIS